MEKTVDWQNYEKQIQALASLDFNYDEKMYHDGKDKSGWVIDRYQATLGQEPRGPVQAGGPFEAVKETIQAYKFPNPKLIYALFDPQQPLPGRNMLMFAHFAGFTFSFGVRIVQVIDETRSDEQGDLTKVWGYSYRTLKGHFEIGEIRFEVSKSLRSGQIDFEINAYSRPDRIPNFFFRTGFKIFGRQLQKYFAQSSIQRLQRIAQKAT